MNGDVTCPECGCSIPSEEVDKQTGGMGGEMPEPETPMEDAAEGGVEEGSPEESPDGNGGISAPDDGGSRKSADPRMLRMVLAGLRNRR